MEKPPKPFPLSDQYINAVAPVDANPKGGEEATETPAASKKKEADQKRRKTKKDKDRDHDGGELPKPVWNYNEIRSNFMKNYRHRFSVSFAEAKTAWDNSTVKRQYLGPVSVQELKRRKFIPKDAEVNPWA